jgi:hypothetical protein
VARALSFKEEPKMTIVRRRESSKRREMRGMFIQN